MKTVEVNIEGNSLLAYVTFYNEDILSKLNEMDEGEYDFIEFSSANQKESIFLGRGFCEDGDINLNVSVDGTELFNCDVYHINDEESPSQEIKKIFQDEYGEDEDYEEYLVAKKVIASKLTNIFLPTRATTSIARLKRSNATNRPTPSRLKLMMTSSCQI